MRIYEKLMKCERCDVWRTIGLLLAVEVAAVILTIAWGMRT